MTRTNYFGDVSLNLLLLKIIGEAGYTLRRDFDFFRSNQSVKSDPAPYLRITVEAKF